ncbi:MAG TPA: M23 family metallopeptidase [Longimicrobiaceae bacterium]|nr:M23 family metallopeptidase [Longimicrobiaceae bacterium]
MRSSRFLLPFTLGAISMLVVVIAAAWAAPGVLGRMRAAPGPGGTSPGAAAGVAAAPAASADEVPFAVAPAGDASKLLIPVQGVKAASLVDTYEQARGQGRRHDAIDIAAPRGTPVLAASDGVVMKLFLSERGGITLYELAPDRRTIYYYAHLDRYAPGMAEGRALRRGEVLGYVGDTGDAEPGNYHLHFEVSTTPDPARYWGGVPQNPYPLLR